MQNIDAFDRQFPTDEACKDFVVAMRWPKGVSCPRCKADQKIYALKARPYHWICKNADCGGRNGYRFSVTTATIFEDTKIGLRLWFKVGYLMMVSKKGISALQIHRVIFGEESGSDHHTSWYMCHRWRAAMKGDIRKLKGEVEIDETYIGGSDRNRHKNKRVGIAGPTTGGSKAAVIGAIARKGNVTCQVLGRVTGQKMDEFVRRAVSSKVSLVATDEHKGYARLNRYGFPHETVTHAKGEYVRGNVHTANLDSFWSLLKRYLNEFSFRHNNRDNMGAFGALVATCAQ